MSMPAALLTLRATDQDSGRNGRVSYSILSSSQSLGATFHLDPNGTLWLNATEGAAGQRIAAAEIHLVAMAEDGADTPANRKRSFVSIRLSNLQHAETGPPQFERNEFTVSLEPGTPIGSRVANLATAAAQGATNLFYSLEAASSNPYLEVESTTGALVLKKCITDPAGVPEVLGIMLRRDNRLGDETHAKVNLDLSALSLVSASPDKQGLFSRRYYDVSLSENTATGNIIFRLNNESPSNNQTATEAVSAYEWRIAAGNLNNTFQMSPTQPGAVMLLKPLDYEQTREFRLIILATRQAIFQTITLIIKVVDENDNTPFFPIPRQIHSVVENAAPGSLVFTARAVDLDGTDALRYALASGASNEFVLGETNGRLVTKRSFDYEQEQEFSLVITATDSAGSVATTDVTIRIESADEYYPAYDSTAYQYTLDHTYPVGHVIGRLRATDRDAGPDGRVVYSLRTSGSTDLVTPDSYFHVDPDSGEIAVSRSLDTGVLLLQESAAVRGGQQQLYQDITISVQAGTGRPNSLKTTALVTLHVRTDILPPAPRFAASGSDEGLAVWAQALIIVLVLALVIIAAGIFLYRRFSLGQLIQKRLLDTTDASTAGVGRHHYDAALSQQEGGLDGTSVSLSQYPPPQYSDIVSQYSHGGHKGSSGHHPAARPSVGGRLTLHSELSEQSHRSASSGRGSAEDVEEEVDHEIQMINGGNGLNDTSCLAEDTISEISVQNGKVSTGQPWTII
jgi:protocadherin-16/23